MRERIAVVLIAVVVVTVTACTSTSSTAAGAGFNAGTTSIVNPSSKTGGIVTYEALNPPDSMDPGNSYGWTPNINRLYSRSLVTWAPKPGAAGLELVPDLATSLGRVSDDGTTWTYTLRHGVKYQDGTDVRSADVKYAIERSNYLAGTGPGFVDPLTNGATYFHDVLVDNTPPYEGPFKDHTGDLKSIEIPDNYTIVFHLKAPFAEFDYLVASGQTVPVPRAKDTGAGYETNIQSTGSYMIKSYHRGTSVVLVRNPYWSAATDPLRKQYADEIDVRFGKSQIAIDDDLFHDRIAADAAGNGIDVLDQPGVLSDPARKANADVAITGVLTYVAISTAVAPLDNLDCRKAVEYAVDKTSVQTVMGGPVRGQIASTALPPNIAGYTKFDLYPTPNDDGDITKAKQELAKCGRPDGFSIGLAARIGRPTEVAAATAIQAALRKVGIKVTISQYDDGKYFSDFAGAPDFVHAHQLGLIMSAWVADWGSGYGFFHELISNVKEFNNYNLSELRDAKINALLDNAIQNPDPKARNNAWGDVDQQFMADAAIVPLTFLSTLLYRPPSATNMFVDAGSASYDLLNIGTTK
jgi:peptide/nickel transport system substrate-binding protein